VSEINDAPFCCNRLAAHPSRKYAVESHRKTERARTKTLSESERQKVDAETDRSLQSYKGIQATGAQ
jgi:hypothetical protein